MDNVLIIETQLPSLNEYQYACRTHWSKGQKFKAEAEETIGWYIHLSKAQKRLRAVKNPCEIHIEWHEGTRKRDVDNIQSAQKFILDALQQYKILINDSRKYVKQIHHNIIDDTRTFVIVRFIEEESKQ